MKGRKPGPTFDKDWQQSRGSRKRLEQISRHFLSEIQPLSNKPPDTVFLPVFVESESHRQVPRHITEAMVAKFNCALLNLDRRLQRPEDKLDTESAGYGFNVPLTRKQDLDSADDMLERLQAMVSEQSQKAKLGLVALTRQHLELIKRLRRIIIPVSATLDGVRNAYLAIKQLHKMANPEFSIVMLDTDSPSDSQVYFEKLAAGTLRFLGLHILYNGYIPDHTELKFDDEKLYRQEIMAVLASRVIQNHRLCIDDSYAAEDLAFPSISEVNI